MNKKKIKERFCNFEIIRLKNKWVNKLSKDYHGNIPYSSIECFFIFLDKMWVLYDKEDLVSFVENIIVHHYFDCIPLIDTIQLLTIIEDYYLIRKFNIKKNWEELILEDYNFQKRLLIFWFDKKIKKG